MRFALVTYCAVSAHAYTGLQRPPVIRRASAPRCVASSSPLTSAAAYLDDIPQGAPDAILGIAQNFRECTAETKVNLAIGAYRDDGGTPFVLPSVRAAEARLLERGEKKEYAP